MKLPAVDAGEDGGAYFVIMGPFDFFCEFLCSLPPPLYAGVDDALLQASSPL